MHASRLIAALLGAAAFGAGAVGAQAQTSAPVMTMAPMPAPATPASAPLPRPGANADTAPPVPGAPPASTASPAGPEASAPLPPVHTMAPRPLSSGGMAPGGTSGGLTGPGSNPSTVPGSPALNARLVVAHRTATGYVLSGQAQVKDGCQAARFDATGQAPSRSAFTLVQYRNPANRGVMCTQMVRWVPASRTVTSAKPPAVVTVRTAAGTKRIAVR